MVKSISKYQAMKKNSLITFNQIFLIVFSLFIFNTLEAQGDNKLKIVRGVADTVNSSNHYIVGVAPAGSKIFINNNSVYQYSTGSFGQLLSLIPGNNSINVKAIIDGKEYFETFNIYLKESQVIERSLSDYSFPVVRTLKGAYLNSSPGEDRLGGAKINFLDEGINMHLVDSLNNLYIVQLSQKRLGYIPKHLVEHMPLGTEPALTVTGSFRANKEDKYDRVSIGLNSRVPYIYYRDIENNQIVIDLYSSKSNSNWITHMENLEMVDYVNIQQLDFDVSRVVVKLKKREHWGYKLYYRGNILTLDVKHSPDLRIKGLVIGIDAGHGGSNLGAVSPSGIMEKDLNLDMALTLKRELERRGAKVVMSRDEDINLSMQERLNIFLDADVDLMISIHCNAGGNPLRPMGVSTYYRHLENRDLAQSILNRMLELDVNNFGLIGNFNFSLNAPTEFPNVLVETLFLSSLPDEVMMADKRFRDRLMKKVVKGLNDYLRMLKRQ